MSKCKLPVKTAAAVKGFWSGEAEYGMAEVPPVGSRINVMLNGLGPATVVGYFVEHGYLGLYVAFLSPPDWWKEQTKGMSLTERRGMVFGSEVEAIK